MRTVSDDTLLSRLGGSGGLFHFCIGGNEVVGGHGVAGLKAQGLVEIGDSLFVLLELEEGNATLIVADGVVGSQLDCFVGIGHSRFGLLLIAVEAAAVDIAVNLVGEFGCSEVEVCLGLSVFLQGVVDGSTAQDGMNIVRDKLDDFVQVINGSIAIVHGDVKIGTSGVEERGRWCHRDCEIQVGHGILRVFQLHPDLCPGEDGIHIVGIIGERLIEVLDGFLILLRLNIPGGTGEEFVGGSRLGSEGGTGEQAGGCQNGDRRPQAAECGFKLFYQWEDLL